MYGISILQRYKILITARSKGTIGEFRKYKRAVDKHGNPLNKPIDKFNHAIDAARYGAMELLGGLTAEPDLYVTDEEQERMDKKEAKERKKQEEEDGDDVGIY